MKQITIFIPGQKICRTIQEGIFEIVIQLATKLVTKETIQGKQVVTHYYNIPFVIQEI